jgi:hypothetical protein
MPPEVAGYFMHGMGKRARCSEQELSAPPSGVVGGRMINCGWTAGCMAAIAIAGVNEFDAPCFEAHASIPSERCRYLVLRDREKAGGL